MGRLTPLIAFGIAACVLAAAAVGATRIPGGPASKPLAGTWRTTLTAADVHRLASGGSRSWTLVVGNAKYLSYPHALGFGPTGSGRDTVPFGVSGHHIYLACLNDGGIVAGYATYTWSIANGALRFTRVAEPCRDPVTRDRIVVLTSHPWHDAERRK
jgi:hypothetical protein